MLKKILSLLMILCIMLFSVSCTVIRNRIVNVTGNRHNNEESSSEPASSIESSTENEEFMLPATNDTEQQTYRPHYKLGTCRKLQGKPLVVLLFIDDDESKWTAQQVKNFSKNYVAVGLRYLEQEAEKWNVSLEFDIESYSTALTDYEMKYNGRVNENLENGGSTKDIVDHAAKALGFSSNWALYSNFKKERPNEDVIFLALINKDGRSYARKVIATGGLTYAEHSVIFSGDLFTGTQSNRAAVVAHELIHLFGAEDYYEGSREILAERYYPRDIMLYQFDDISKNEIGDVTAYTIGWSNYVPEVCYNEFWTNSMIK